MAKVDAILIDPGAFDARDMVQTIVVDTADWANIRALIGASTIETRALYNEVSPSPVVRIYCDENAKLYNQTPPRFLLPFKVHHRQPVACSDFFGKALIVATSSNGADVANAKRLAGIAPTFPKVATLTPLDAVPGVIGNYVQKKARDAFNERTSPNFQAILTDARYVAACRVVLATFEPFVEAVGWMHDGLTGAMEVVEARITNGKAGAAITLYNDVLRDLGVPDEGDEDEAPAMLDGGHRKLATGAAIFARPF